ncbi:MAG: hypothetical protein ACRD4Q_00060 [Candidatus Acidiferrales bacterium]
MKPSQVMIRQTPQISSAGQVSYIYSVSFMVGQHGPFTVQFSQADFTAANVTQKLNAFAAAIQQIAGTAAAG